MRDRPGSVPDPLVGFDFEKRVTLARQGRIRRHGEGMDEARELILHIKKKSAKSTGGVKFGAVEKRLLESPLAEAFHGKNFSRSVGSGRSIIRTKNKEVLRDQEVGCPIASLLKTSLLVQDNESVVVDEVELNYILSTYLF